MVWLEELGHQIEDPVPSLFTFDIKDKRIKDIPGVVAKDVEVKVLGTDLVTEGPLLITHVGMSAPAILKLSAFGARILADKNYECNLQVNWVNEPNYDKVMDELKSIIQSNGNKQIQNFRAYLLPERLWHFLINKIEIPLTKKWNELGKKNLNKLCNLLTNDVYSVKGKTTFKEEFVTCGGISLDSINFKTMESTVTPNLYFAGEIMDIDGITGGYNFQGAWTTAFIAGKLN